MMQPGGEPGTAPELVGSGTGHLGGPPASYVLCGGALSSPMPKVAAIVSSR